jgi:hypothetical protein
MIPPLNLLYVIKSDKQKNFKIIILFTVMIIISFVILSLCYLFSNLNNQQIIVQNHYIKPNIMCSGNFLVTNVKYKSLNFLLNTTCYEKDYVIHQKQIIWSNYLICSNLGHITIIIDVTTMLIFQCEGINYIYVFWEYGCGSLNLTKTLNKWLLIQSFDEGNLICLSDERISFVDLFKGVASVFTIFNISCLIFWFSLPLIVSLVKMSSSRLSKLFKRESPQPINVEDDFLQMTMDNNSSYVSIDNDEAKHGVDTRDYIRPHVTNEKLDYG